MQTPLEDTKWARVYGSTAAVRAAFDRLGRHYHEAILATGVPRQVAEMVQPYLKCEARIMDFGCGSGVLGEMLTEQNQKLHLEGIDFSPVMLGLARETGCYQQLHAANLLLPEEFPVLENTPYDGAISLGLIGDYVPYYLALPRMRKCVRAGGWLAFSVERSCTSAYALEKLFQELGLVMRKERLLQSPRAQLEPIDYQFYCVEVH